MLQPRKPAPDLVVKTLDGPDWSLNDQNPGRFKLLVFYRGRHSAQCGAYAKHLISLLHEFDERGVDVWAISMDGLDAATGFRDEHGLDNLKIGYALDEETAKKWGLFLSAGRQGEPDRFNEPGLFLIDPRLFVYYESVQNMPHARPPLDGILECIDYALDHDYPARGTLHAA